MELASLEEDCDSVAVGGLAVEMGFYKAPPGRMTCPNCGEKCAEEKAKVICKNPACPVTVVEGCCE